MSIPEWNHTTLFRPGHTAAAYLESDRWEILHQSLGRLRVRAHLPEQVMNPRRQLFGGFTGTYVDLVALATLHSGTEGPREWTVTSNMRIDYLAPVVGPTFVVEGQVTARVGRTRAVDVRFTDETGEPTVLAHVLLRAITEPAVHE